MSKFGLFLILISAVILAVVYLKIGKPFQGIERKNDAVRVKDLETIVRGLDLYYKDYGKYPMSSSGYLIEDANGEVQWGASWSPYIPQIPNDPFFRKYVYVADKNDNYQSFRLFASLEDPSSNPKACVGECKNVPEPNLCGGFMCNYEITSGNVSQ